ncbi:MAG: class I SAM-dependent methyltransferase [Sandaracinaceae bacterium]
MGAAPMTTCPLCAHDGSAVELDGLSGVDGVVRLLRCGDCGLRFIDPPPPRDRPHEIAITRVDAASALGREGTWLSQRMSGAVTALALHQKRRAQLGWLRRAGVRAGDRLLDVGSGSGAFVAAARARGVRAEGLEPAGAQSVDHRGPVPQGTIHPGTIHPGTVLDVDFPEDAFDAITLWSVLEHEPAPRETLAKLAKWLRPGGVLLLEVPDAGSRIARALGRHWPALEPREHACHYDQRTLTRALEAAGLQDVRVHAGSTVAWRQHGSELMLGLASRHRETLAPFWAIESRSAALRAGVLAAFGVGAAIERALGESRLIAVARGAGRSHAGITSSRAGE